MSGSRPSSSSPTRESSPPGSPTEATGAPSGPPEDRARIRQIEGEEWHHRELVGAMLTRLGTEPSRDRERRARVVGRTLGLLCHLAGWLAPM